MPVHTMLAGDMNNHRTGNCTLIPWNDILTNCVVYACVATDIARATRFLVDCLNPAEFRNLGKSYAACIADV
jgi:hypothetical protein